MLLIHQIGAVKVGEVVRYTLTYTPSLDRILPPPSHLHVKIKNSSAIPLRAAYLHGPYTLYVACYPSTFNPYVAHEKHEIEGHPEYEPQLKAGGHWITKLPIPEEIRESITTTWARQSEITDQQRKSFTWIIEIASQVLFSTTASVHYELLVGRDEKSVDLGFPGVVGSGQGAPGRLEDHQYGHQRNKAQQRGIFSKAIKLAVDDTESLWNTPPFPEWNEEGMAETQQGPHHGDKRDMNAKKEKKTKKRQKIHLVILTHGLHSNTGADMLFMKESIDTAAKEAREDAKRMRAESRAKKVADSNDFGKGATDAGSRSAPEIAVAPTGDPFTEEGEDDDSDTEQVLVRGFNGNAVRTERGIQYLGKRLAKYVLSITYPDQPYLPVKSSISQAIVRPFTSQKPAEDGRKPTHKNSSIVKDEEHTNNNLAYQITKISFIGHSLGGLVQTYAIAYIQKHSPGFFDIIEPINFVAMATPFLGLSNENPMYVKFGLDFGLVGRTGQDLGLTWRPAAITKSGWGAMMGGFGSDTAKTEKEPDPGSKPLLRILPTGPAHGALKRFRNRSVYSNIVNDGIVPLRTSCLLFLDWRGLERVEKARRESGLIGTMVEWGWAELTGANASAPKNKSTWNDFFADSGDDSNQISKSKPDLGSKVPQADASQGLDNYQQAGPEKDGKGSDGSKSDVPQSELSHEASGPQPTGLWNGFMSFFKPHASQKQIVAPSKTQKIFSRSQTMRAEADRQRQNRKASTSSIEDEDQNRKPLVRGSSLYTNDSENGDVQAPPRTTFFESAGDLLSPPLPPKELLLDPAARPRTIFHDRVYHPDDIPPPPAKRQKTLLKKPGSKDDMKVPNQQHSDLNKISGRNSTIKTEDGTMRIEEKIARAYHKDLSWRKVLVRLEPDAHNNMIVRRMFANAYGWPVVKHLCDTHFAYTATAETRDEDENNKERVKSQTAKISLDGEQVIGQTDPPVIDEQGRGTHGSKTIASAENLGLDKPTVKDMRRNIQQMRGLQISNARLGDDSSCSPTQTQDRTNIQPLDRTDSEIRESKDKVTDLVSRISATGEIPRGIYSINSVSSSPSSSAAVLSRLVRQDSAVWSDRFFDGSDEESDDEDYLLREIEKAKARGWTDEEIVRKFSFASDRSCTSVGAGASASGQGSKLSPPATMDASHRVLSGKIAASPERSSTRDFSGSSKLSANWDGSDDTGRPGANFLGIGQPMLSPTPSLSGWKGKDRASNSRSHSRNNSGAGMIDVTTPEEEELKKGDEHATDPERLTSGHAMDVGLRKSVEQQILSPSQSASGTNAEGHRVGVAEQVALAQSKSRET